MSMKDVLGLLPDELFPAPVDGKCNERMQGKTSFDRCGLGESHKSGHVTTGSLARAAEVRKAKAGTEAKALAKALEVIKQNGMIAIAADSKEAAAYEKRMAAEAAKAEAGE